MSIPSILQLNMTQVWVDVNKVNGEWMVARTRKLTRFEADWAPGEPTEGTNADCAYMDGKEK